MSTPVEQAERQPKNTARSFRPITGRTSTHHEATVPVAHDCVKLIFVRAGAAVGLSR
jgi:hypothetical protein